MERPGAGLSGLTQRGGKELSFNNLLDLEGALLATDPFGEQVACAIVKHTTPCGLAVAPFLCFVMLVSPIWIEPLFNEFRRLDNHGLEKRLLSLAPPMFPTSAVTSPSHSGPGFLVVRLKAPAVAFWPKWTGWGPRNISSRSTSRKAPCIMEVRPKWMPSMKIGAAGSML